MKVKVLYFAGLREKAGLDEEFLEGPFENPRELYRVLLEKYHFSEQEKILRVAVNHRFEKMDHPLRPMDTVAFIPPVAGG